MLYPETEEALAQTVRECVGQGRPLHTVGHMTKLLHGPLPPDEAEAVSLKNMNAITSYEPGDLVVTVQAGARLEDLQARLAEHRQWLPIDPPYVDATVGGILATNSTGPRRFGYGTVRDLLLGLRVVGPDGSVTRSGGRVVKNVTGYDLHKLHVGAWGSLGVVTEANFKVRPRPEVSAVIAIRADSFGEAHKLLLEVYGSSLRPVALEARDQGWLPSAPGTSQILWKAAAYVGVESSRAVLARHVRELRKLPRAVEVFEGRDAEALWIRLRGIKRRNEAAVRVRVAAKPHDLPALVPPGQNRQASVGNGIARVEVDAEPGLAERVAEWHRMAAAVGGYAVVESAPVDCPERDRLPWGFPGNRLMRAIKNARDPKDVLNRGRMVV